MNLFIKKIKAKLRVNCKSQLSLVKNSSQEVVNETFHKHHSPDFLHFTACKARK